MTVEQLALPEVLLIKPRVFRDDRGELLESWLASSYADHGIGPFVQDNVSISRRGVLRGVHLQHPHGQGKLVSALHGRIFDVAVDVRVGSPTFGRWVGVELTDENRWQLFVPAGFGHGFMAMSDGVVVSYKCTEYYAPGAECTVRWDDPSVGIAWPNGERILSPKDAQASLLADIPPDALPRYEEARSLNAGW